MREERAELTTQYGNSYCMELDQSAATIVIENKGEEIE